jgi:hypothetical protein
MVLLVKVLSVVIIIYGCFLILRPNTLKNVLDWMKEGNRVYTASVIKAVIGFVMILAASSCRISWIVFVLGLLALLSGASVFFIKKSSLHRMVEWLEKKSPKEASIIGTAALCMGVLLTLAA